jgi:hypothetical protein
MSTTNTENVDRSTQRWEVQPSDRTAMMEQANELVFSLILKTKPRRSLGGAVDSGPSMSPAEQQAYEAALGFLARQFQAGPTEPSSHLIESAFETEKKLEQQGDDDPDKDTQENAEGSEAMGDKPAKPAKETPKKTRSTARKNPQGNPKKDE